MQYKIVNTIGPLYTKEAKQIIESLGTVDYVEWSQSDLLENIENYDIAIIGLGLQFDNEVLTKAKKLKAICTATTGLDHIDKDTAKQNGIEILSLKNETEFLNTITGTAELGWGLLLDLTRGISKSIEEVKQYKWERENFRGNELRGKTLGIVGLGRLGRMMARYGHAFYMNVIAHDPHISDSEFSDLEVTSVSFQELLEKSDVVSVNVHLSNDTEKMFDQKAFNSMKDSALFINTARGKIVDESALLETLQNKKIKGYATDVLDGELNFHQSFEHHPLVEYAKNNDNLLISPHIGGMTVESRAATDIFIAKKLNNWLGK